MQHLLAWQFSAVCFVQLLGSLVCLFVCGGAYSAVDLYCVVWLVAGSQIMGGIGATWRGGVFGPIDSAVGTPQMSNLRIIRASTGPWLHNQGRGGWTLDLTRLHVGASAGAIAAAVQLLAPCRAGTLSGWCASAVVACWVGWLR